VGPTAPHSREREARYDAQVAHSRSHRPVCEEGEDLLAERQAMEARHALERRRWEARFARYLMRSVLPLEGEVKDRNSRELKPTG
jgi:hypothetical protein